MNAAGYSSQRIPGRKERVLIPPRPQIK